jgi:general secretion pathway protein M
MIAWWAGRSRREQLLLGVMAAIALVLVAWFGILQPLAKARRAAAERLSEAAATQAAVERGLAELAALRRAAPARPNRRPMARAVTESAAAAGVTLARAEPDPGGGLRVGIEAVAPAALFPWLAALQRDDGVAASHLTVVKADGGGLNVDATLVEIGR